MIDPIDGSYINVFSDRVMELIHKEGYTIHDILTLSKQILPTYNRSNVFNNDMLYNYMLHLDVNDIKSVCLVDKNVQSLCHNSNFWKNKIVQDFYGYIDVNENKNIEKLNINDIPYDMKTYERLGSAKKVADMFSSLDDDGGEIDLDDYDQLETFMNLSNKFYNKIATLPEHYNKNDITLNINSTTVTIEIEYQPIYKKRVNVKMMMFKIFYLYPNTGYSI